MTNETERLIKQFERENIEFEQERANDDITNILALQRHKEERMNKRLVGDDEMPIILRKEDRELFE